MYRLKEAIIIFWKVLTHENYVFFSSKNGNSHACEWNSKPVENNHIFWDAVSEFASNAEKSIKNNQKTTL